MKWIQEKMKVLGCDNHPSYKLAFYLDSRAMISIHSAKYGVIEVKPLGVIWGKFPQYNKSNTIMFDDLRRNFLMNPSNGLKIKPFKNAHTNRSTDRELLKLAKYLKKIASLPSFDQLDHKHWEKTTQRMADDWCTTHFHNLKYFLDYKKNIRFDFDGEIKIRYVRCKHLPEITITKVQLFWRLPYEM